MANNWNYPGPGPPGYQMMPSNPPYVFPIQIMGIYLDQATGITYNLDHDGNVDFQRVLQKHSWDIALILQSNFEITVFNILHNSAMCSVFSLQQLKKFWQNFNGRYEFVGGLLNRLLQENQSCFIVQLFVDSNIISFGERHYSGSQQMPPQVHEHYQNWPEGQGNPNAFGMQANQRHSENFLTSMQDQGTSCSEPSSQSSENPNSQLDENITVKPVSHNAASFNKVNECDHQQDKKPSNENQTASGELAKDQKQNKSDEIPQKKTYAQVAKSDVSTKAPNKDVKNAGNRSPQQSSKNKENHSQENEFSKDQKHPKERNSNDEHRKDIQNGDATMGSKDSERSGTHAEPPQTSNKGTSSKLQDNDVLATVFNLYIPKRYGQAKQVYMVSDCTELSDLKLVFNEKSGHWTTDNVTIPLNVQHEPWYKYTVKFDSHVFLQIVSLGRKTSNKCTENDHRTWNICKVKRDTFKSHLYKSDEYYEDPLEGLQHYTNEIIDDVNKETIKSYILEWFLLDYLSIMRNAYIHVKDAFIQWCGKKISECNSTQALFVTLLLCCGTSNPRFNLAKNVYFSRETAQSCMKAFSFSHHTMLPKEAQDMLSQYVGIFVSTATDSRLCILSLVGTFFPVLDKAHILKLKLNCNKETKIDLKRAHSIVLHLVDMLGKEEGADVLLIELIQMIKDVGLLIGIANTLRNLKCLQSEHMDDIKQQVKCNLDSKVMKQIKEFKNPCHLKKFNEILLQLCECDDLGELEAKIEDQVLIIVDQRGSKWDDEMKQILCDIINYKGLFHIDGMICLLETIAGAKTYSQRSVLVNLLNDKKVISLVDRHEKVQPIVITAMNETINQTYGGGSTRAITLSKAQHVYAFLDKIISTTVVKSDEVLRIAVKQPAKKWLFKKDLGLVMDCRFSLPDDFPQEILNEHVQEYLEKELEEKKDSDMNSQLVMLLGTDRKLNLTSSTSTIVTTILEKNMANKYFDTDMVISSNEALSDIFGNADFWRKIFNAEGYGHQRILKHPATQNVQRVIKKLGKMIEAREISFKMAVFLNNEIKKHNQKEICDAIFKYANDWEEKCLIKHMSGIMDDCNAINDSLDDVANALQVADKIQSNGTVLVTDLDSHRDFLHKVHLSLKEGSVALKHLIEEQSHLGKWKDLYNKVVILKEAVKIHQFGLFLKEEINCHLHILAADPDNDDDVGGSLAVLFDEYPTEKVTILESGATECTTNTLLNFICINCVPKFENLVDKLLFSEGDVALVDVTKFFKTQTISDNELRKLEIWRRKTMPPTIRKSIGYIANFHEIHTNAVDLDRFSGVFNIRIKEDSSELAQSILQILHMQMKARSLTMKDLHEKVSKVENAFDIVSKDWGVIHELSKAKTLITFLTEVADDDLRNLIDAVEEHSEQYVQESTVSDLIQVKRFLYPLLHNKCTTVHELIDQLKHCKTEQLENVPTQINTCMSNLHSLKVLYNSVANRGEVTKEVVSNILQRGIVRYVISPEKNDLAVQCTKKKKVDSYGLSEMRDLRSRCLLISNTEKTNKSDADVSMMENMKCFIEMTNTIISIWDLAVNLRNYGHCNYQKFIWRTSEQNPEEKMRELFEIEKKLKQQFAEWESILELVRRHEYYLNFIHSEQITILLDFFEKGVESDQVQQIMQYLSANITVNKEMQSYFKSNYSETENGLQRKLESLGCTMGSIMKMSTIPHTLFPQDEEFTLLSRNIDAHAKHGQLYMAHVDTKSIHFVPILLSLYANTTGKFPKPHEILVCDEKTKWEEIQLIINRSILYTGDNSEYNLHVIVGIERLDYEVQNNLVSALHLINRLESSQFLLAVMCRESTLHPIVVEFSKYVHRIPGLSDEALSRCFKEVCPSVYTVTSEVPGLGKTETIFERASQQGKRVQSVHVSGPVDKRNLAKLFIDCQKKSNCVLHIDVGVVDNPVILDSFLFELIVLKCAVSGTIIAHLPTHDVAIEVANTLRQQLRNDLFMMSSFERVHLNWKNFNNFVVGKQLKSPVQIVCHYLNALEQGTVGVCDVLFYGKQQVSPLPQSVCCNLLQRYLSSSTDLSFSIATVFLNVLSQQFLKLSNSQYFRVANLKGMLKTKELVSSVRITLVEALVDISKEFACRSIHTCKSAQHIAIDGTDGALLKETEAMLKRVEGMIRWSDSNHLLVVFHTQNIQTVSPLYRQLLDVPKHIQDLFHTQIGKDLLDFDTVEQKELQDMLGKIVSSSTSTSKELDELSKTYALTPDNLLKMVLIIMRIRSSTPVVLMGETGCGKTSLVRYLAKTCDIEFKIFPLHAGITRYNIISMIASTNEEAKRNRKKEMWLFLDEINTCNHLGLLNDILCHRVAHNIRLSPNLKCIAACNPYRIREKSLILTSGLGGKTSLDQFSQLVYRVHPLPETMIDYVWDYGTLSDVDEEKYITRMVQVVIQKLPTNTVNSKLVHVLAMSQLYIRTEEQNEWCVSLRDINRCCHLIPWFYRMLQKKANFSRKTYNKPDSGDEFVYRSVILSLAHCYEVRLQSSDQRIKFWQKMAVALYNDKKYSYYIMEDIVRHEQMDILERMEIEEGIAKNTALRENVFVMFVCIMNKIPVFVVGKPGCSKSLSMQLLKSNLRGLDSGDEYFQTLPQIYVVSYQGSESSTSEGIIKIFEKAEKYRNQQKIHGHILPVVLLDEIGLAEISKFNPLKVLHSLLEPQTGTFPEVAVVGISNWSLDPAKMNRAIHLSRPDLNKEELYDTGRSISTIAPKENQIIDEDAAVKTTVDDKTLRALSEAYFEYHRNQSVANFHGLRDYYALVKFISRKLLHSRETSERPEELEVILNGLMRNFGGIPSEINKIIEIFCRHLSVTSSLKVKIDSLIYDNIADQNARHLLLITSGDSVIGEIGGILKLLKRDYRIFYGSSFDEDQKEEYSYRMLSSIIYCMSHGLVLILKDLDEIYGSLYDMLNQNYTVVGKKKNCRIALGAHSNPMCHVHENFRCIVLVEEKRIDYSDPPFLNRFEKQRLKFEDLLDEDETNVTQLLQEWVDGFVAVETNFNSVFTIQDAFLGLHEETIPSLVKAAKSQNPSKAIKEIVEICKRKLMFTCTPDAILRLSCSSLSCDENFDVKNISSEYFDLPINDGLKVAVDFILENEQNSKHGIKFVCFTRSNIHSDIRNILGNEQEIQIENLGTFKSERQMTSQIEAFFNDQDMKLLIVQCSVTTDIDHLLLAKLQVENKRNQYTATIEKNELGHKHVCFLLHLDKRETNGESVQWQFDYSDEWHLYTVDVLDYGEMVPEMKDMFNEGIMRNLLNQNESDLLKSNFHSIDISIKRNMLWAFSCLLYTCGDRPPNNMKHLIEKIVSCDDIISCISDMILKGIQSREAENTITINDSYHWQVRVACNMQMLSEGCSMVEAWRKHLESLVKSPLAKIVWAIENMGAWESIILSKQGNWIFDIWVKQLEKHISDVDISNSVLPQGMMSMIVDYPPLALVFPFSRIFLDKMKNIYKLICDDKLKLNLGTDNVAELPQDQFIDLVMKYTNVIENQFMDIYEGCGDLADSDKVWQIVTEDFCNEFSWYPDVNLEESVRIQACQRFCDSRIERLGNITPVARITAFLVTYTVENSRIWALLRLFSICDAQIVKDTLIMLDEKSKINVDENVVNDIKLDDSSTNNVTFIEDTIATKVTESVIPFASKLLQYGGIKNWFEHTSTILSYNSKVGGESDNINFIRFCFDMVTCLIDPCTLDDAVLVQFTKCAFSEHGSISLDSENVFEYLTDVCNQNKDTSANANTQKLVALFFARCFESSPETPLLDNMLDCIVQNELPDGNLNYIGPFLQCILFDLEDTLENISEIWTEDFAFSDQLQTLEKYVTDEAESTPVFVMCVDIVVHMLDKATNIGKLQMEELETGYDDFVLSIEKLKEDKLSGIQKMICLAYCKVYLQSVSSCCNSFSPGEVCNVLQKIDSVLLTNESCVKSPFYKMLICRISRGSMKDLQTKCENLKEILPGLNSVLWSEDDILNGLGFDVFSLSDGYDSIMQAVSNFQESDAMILEVLKKAQYSEQIKKDLIGAVQIKFYWPKCVQGHRNDTDKSFGIWLEKNTAHFDAELRRLLLCLSGHQDFNSEVLNISTQHSYESILQASVLNHLAGIVIPQASYSEDSLQFPRNIFTICILNPEEAMSCYIPQQYCLNTSITYKQGKCRCSHVLIAVDGVKSCPACRSKDVHMIDVTKATSISPMKKQLTLREYIESPNQPKSVVHNIIKLLLEGALIVSYAMGMKKTPFLTESEYKILVNDFQKMWSKLQNILFESPLNFVFLLHKIIHEHQSLFKEDVNQEDAQSVQMYANQLEQIIQCHLTGGVPPVVGFCKEVFSKSGISGTLTEDFSRIGSSIETRQTRKPTMQHMVSMMSVHTDLPETKLPFLKLLIQWEEKLVLLHHLLPVLQWQLEIHHAVNHKYTRYEASSTDMHKFIFQDETGMKEELKKKYENFTKALSSLRKIENYEILLSQLPEVAIPDISYRTYLTDCIVENSQHFMVSIVEYLVRIQNRFLEECSRLSLENHHSLRFLPQRSIVCIPSKSVQQLKAADVINFQWSEQLLRFSQNETDMDSGDGIVYDFFEIEKELAYTLLLGKPFLDVPNHIFKTIYKNEMFHWCSHIFRDINDQIPQEGITCDMQNSIIQGTNENLESLRSTLDYLEVVITKLYKTGGNVQDTISMYAERWDINASAIKSKTIVAQMKNYLRLCHVVSLYEFLEDKLSYIALEAISKEYCQAIPDSVHKDLVTFIEKNFVPVESFQVALRRLISRYLCSGDYSPISPKSPMKVLMCQPPLWPNGVEKDGVLVGQKKVDGKLQKIDDVFPDVFFMEHVSATHRFVTQCIQDKKTKVQPATIEKKTTTARNRKGRRQFFQI